MSFTDEKVLPIETASFYGVLGYKKIVWPRMTTLPYLIHIMMSHYIQADDYLLNCW